MSKQILHNTIADKIVEIGTHKFYNVGTNPKGARNCPLLANGTSRAHLDIQYDARDGSGIRYLGDISIGNPLSETLSRGPTPSWTNVIPMIRAKKNIKYRDPIATLQLTILRVFAFPMYGQFSSEVLDYLEEVADYVHKQNPLLVPKALLLRKYRRELSCVVHKGVARLLSSRIDYLRVSSNQTRQYFSDIGGVITSLQGDVVDEHQNVF
jgi:hypothetical protein